MPRRCWCDLQFELSEPGWQTTCRAPRTYCVRREDPPDALARLRSSNLTEINMLRRRSVVMFMISLNYKMDTVWICHGSLKPLVHDFFKTFRHRLNLVSSPQPTCLNQVLHGRKPLVDGCAHWAVDEHTREVDIAHQSSSGQPCSLVRSTNVTCYQSRQTVWPGNVLKLAPPTRHNQGHIKTWVKTNVDQFEWWFSTTRKLNLLGFTL